MSLSKIESASITDGAISAADLASNLDLSGKTVTLPAGVALPSQTGQSGKFLTTDGSDATWENVDALPSQTDQGGKFLTTDGSSASWATVVTGPSITSLTYPGDDTAVDTASPGQCVLIGTAFETGSVVYVDTVTPSNSATGISISGTTQITFTPPAKLAATYNLWVVGPSGRLTVFANGIQYSGTPSWSGQSTSLIANSAAVNIQLSAIGDAPLVYTLVSGTLPTGVTLSSSGLISGAATGLVGNTTFPNLVIKAQDPQSQDSSITITLDLIVQHQISRSLRFNSADQSYLTRTPVIEGNRQTFTWSGWVKRTTSANITALHTVQEGGSEDSFAFSGNIIRFYVAGIAGNGVVTDAIIRDPSAWYHIVLSVDTTQTLDTNRAKIYVNGVNLTSSNSYYPGLNTSTRFNGIFVNYIGRYANQSMPTGNLDGYLAEVNFIDGQALTPDSFGGYDPDTGVWRPIGYTGSYGVNGFHLNFSNNSSVSNLGLDSSANNNHWTPSGSPGFSVTAGASNDSLVDSPTRFGTDTGLGGEVRGNYATLNPLTKLNWLAQPGSAITTTNGNLEIASIGSGGNMMDATIAVTSGKWYWEVTFSSNTFAGIRATRGIPTGDITYRLYTSGSITYCPYNSTSQTTLTTVASIASGDVVGFALDLDNNTIAWYKNGSLLYTATSIVVDEYTPCAGAATTSGGIVSNFGQRPFAYTAPSGFKALCTTNLPTPTIVDSSKYFDTVLYTGNNGNPLTVTGFNFRPDLVWTKDRTLNGGNHLLNDVVRGTNKSLFSNQTLQEYTDRGVDSFNSDGFTYSTQESGDGNYSTNSYVAWCWKAAETLSKTYVVTVVSSDGNKYRFDGFVANAVTLELSEGGTFRFDQSHASNAGHPLRFSTTANGTHGGGVEYTTGVTTFGTPGSAGAYTEITVAAGAPTLYYYCTIHSGMGGQANTPTTNSFSNFDGTIQSNISPNTTSGFSIVTYTGNGSNATIGHGLGVAPSLIIHKRRDASADWNVYHSSLGKDTNIILNTTAASYSSTTWNNTAPTSSVYSIVAGANTNSATYIAYCFAEVEGFSKFGSYTGNGSADGPFIYTGFRPGFIIYKRSNGAGNDWRMVDSKRALYNVVDTEFLYPNQAIQENANNNDAIDILSNGFKQRTLNQPGNEANSTYIYMAFAENPFKTSLAR